MDEVFAHVEGSKQRKKGMLPPDGGWGYMVCIGVGFTFVSMFYMFFNVKFVLFTSTNIILFNKVFLTKYFK